MSIKQKIALLSWFILECKYVYYHNTNLRGVSDAFYDKYEDVYKLLCKQESVIPTATEMVGFDFERPSCKLVVELVNKNKGISKKLIEKIKEIL